MGRILETYKKIHPIKNGVILYYDAELDFLVPKVNRFLEIGVRRTSAMFWHQVYPEAELVFCDVANIGWPDIKATYIRGSINDVAVFEEICNHGPYDIICEDADHHVSTQIPVFKKFWDYFTGLYIIEDIQSFESVNRDDRWTNLKKWIVERNGWYLFRPEYEFFQDWKSNPPILGEPTGKLNPKEGIMYAMKKKPEL